MEKLMKYAIWNKKDPILTPVGEVISAEGWIQRFPIAGLDSITVVCAAGEINGAFFGTLGSMVEEYSRKGCDFSTCESDEDKIAAMEAFDEELDRLAAENSKNVATNEEITASSLASIAASLEYQNMMTLEDMEV
jgi:hypothetical protein